jgi:hypothetical protein
MAIRFPGMEIHRAFRHFSFLSFSVKMMSLIESLLTPIAWIAHGGFGSIMRARGPGDQGQML